MLYLYKSTQLSSGPIKVVSVYVSHRTSGTPATWGNTITKTWDGTTGLHHNSGDNWRPNEYFDMEGYLGPEPYRSHDPSLSTVASLYNNGGKYWPKISWSWKKSGSNVTWTLIFKQKAGPKTVTATFDKTGYPLRATSVSTESTLGIYTARVNETISPYTGPPIVSH
jgi:hypothetical protein